MCTPTVVNNQQADSVGTFTIVLERKVLCQLCVYQVLLRAPHFLRRGGERAETVLPTKENCKESDGCVVLESWDFFYFFCTFLIF